MDGRQHIDVFLGQQAIGQLREQVAALTTRAEQAEAALEAANEQSTRTIAALSQTIIDIQQGRAAMEADRAHS